MNENEVNNTVQNSAKPKPSGDGIVLAIVSIVISLVVIIINYLTSEWVGGASNEYSRVARIFAILFVWAAESTITTVAIILAVLGHIKMKKSFKERGLKDDKKRSVWDIVSIVFCFHPILNAVIFLICC